MKSRPVCLGGVAAAALTLTVALPPVARGKPMERGTAVECVHDGVRKRLEVVAHPRPGRVCEVWYADTKTGWTNKIMWYSGHDRAYCHKRADGMIATLARTRWVCDVIRKRKPGVDARSEAESIRNQDSMQPVGEMRSVDSIPLTRDAPTGGGEPALVVPRPPGPLGDDTESGSGEFRNGPDQTDGEPDVIVPQPRN